MTLINGFEYSSQNHMLCLNTKGLILGSHQDTIDEVRQQGGIVVICHPRWVDGNYWTAEQINRLYGVLGMEIYNQVIFRMRGTGLATDVWDDLLSRGHLLWGFGNDDFHRWYDLAKAWNVVYSAPGVNSVMNALREGRFYVSTGLRLQSFSLENGVIAISASALNGFPQPLRYAFIGEHGSQLSVQEGDHAEYRLDGSQACVRVCVSSLYGTMLWTRPVYDLQIILF